MLTMAVGLVPLGLWMMIRHRSGRGNCGTNTSDLLDGVVGLAHRPQRPVGHRAQVGMLLLEDHGQVVHRCHILLVDPSSHRRSSGRRCERRSPKETNMSPTIRSLVIPVSDLDAAKALYTALLGAPHTDQPYYVGYNVDGFEVSLAPGDVAGGAVAFADVEDLDATRATLLAAGATERSAPRQVAPEARVCVLADADGNPIGLRDR
jgi:predicted enzyme related to lactoylglutathione lyase